MGNLHSDIDFVLKDFKLYEINAMKTINIYGRNLNIICRLQRAQRLILSVLDLTRAIDTSILSFTVKKRNKNKLIQTTYAVLSFRNVAV